MYALVDCNNFYASCERVFNPSIINSPVVVLSNNDGCVIARSNEAKAIGIKMGAPAFTMKPLIEKHGVQVFSSNYALYGDMSNRVMHLLSNFSPEIEVYSIDEIFIKLQGYEFFDLHSYGREMISKIKTCTGIPISVGIAPTKSLAKIANKMAKKFHLRTNGVVVLRDKNQIEKALRWTQIDNVWGVGRQYAKKLLAIQVKNAFDFVNLPSQYVLKEMTIVGHRLQRDLSGIPTLTLEEIAKKKNIAVTRAFASNVDDYEELKLRVSSYVAKLAFKLRQEKSCCSLVYLFIHTNPHRQDHNQYNNGITIKMPYPTNSTIILTKYLIYGLERIFKKEYLYKKAGLIAMQLTPDNERQLSLFFSENPKHKDLMRTVDRLNKICFGKVKFGSQDLNSAWKMRQEHLSKRYTTRLNEIINVKTN